MRTLFSSFYIRLSALFLVLLLVMGAIYILFSVQSSIAFVKEADQRMNADLASSIAIEFEPFIQDSVNTAEIKHLMHYLMVMNPFIEIYLLDSTGTILAFFADHEKKIKREAVALAPIQKFIERTKDASVLGDDPRDPNRRKPFSAAPVSLGDGAQGYIYVILGGEQYDLASAAIREQFMTTTIIRGLLISFIFTAVLGFVLFFFMTRRLRNVSEVVTGFKEGNYEQRLDDRPQDDFGQLATAFNQMADTIERNIADLKRSDHLRRELVANVSHDLRTPLASIQGYLETILIKRDSMPAEEINRCLQISLHNANYLNRLVTELFELSKLNAHEIRPVKEPFSISELIQDVVLKYKPSADAKAIELTCGLDRGLPQVTGDIGMIERVLSNLLDNAIRYVSEKAHVSIDSVPVNNSVRISISDTGPGIAAEDVPHIFSPYFRGKRNAPRESQGTGLGLAITKRILELHDSDISVETAPAKGTTFTFDLSVA